jgi:hypothetical protein
MRSLKRSVSSVGDLLSRITRKSVAEQQSGFTKKTGMLGELKRGFTLLQRWTTTMVIVVDRFDRLARKHEVLSR